MLPVRVGTAPRLMIPWFPVVGLVLGLFTACFDTLVRLFYPPLAASVLDVALLALLTGGLHVDGLADTADGLLGLHDRERALAIMKDSRVGAMGLLAVALCLGMKVGALEAVADSRFLVLVVVPAHARASLLFAMRKLPYGGDRGTGRDFFLERMDASVFVLCAVPVLVSLALGWRAIVINAALLVFCLTMVRYYERRIGCVTGDMLGAMVEVGEAFFLLALAARGPL